jgi:hypothetical protein
MLNKYLLNSIPNKKVRKGSMVWFFRRTFCKKNLPNSVNQVAVSLQIKLKNDFLGKSTRNHSKIGGCHFCSLVPCSNLHLIPSFFDGALPGIRTARERWCVPLGSAWPRRDPPTSPPRTRLRSPAKLSLCCSREARRSVQELSAMAAGRAPAAVYCLRLAGRGDAR